MSGSFPNQTLALYRYGSEDKIEKILYCAIGPGQAKQGTHQAALSQGGVGRGPNRTIDFFMQQQHLP